MTPAAPAVPRRRARRAAAALLAAATAGALAPAAVATAATTNPNPGALELQNGTLSRQAATQGMVLLENADHTLPLASSGNLAVFGPGAYKTAKGGTGAGNVNNRSTTSVRQGLENAGYQVTTSDAYWNAVTAAYTAKYARAEQSGLGASVDYASIEQPLTDATAAPKAPTDTAVYVLSRTAGEGADRSAGPGDYQLGQVERDDLALLGRTYRRVVVLLNVGGIVDTSFYAQINSAQADPAGGPALDAMLLMSQAGQNSGDAVTDVLTGKVTPSGKLTDTWASQYAYYPASGTFSKNDATTANEQYREGIYVGYRYFDSFANKTNPADPASVVNYPFGYGLSYTDFAITPLKVSADINTVTVTARVTNIGAKASGRQVVQAYVSAPQTGLDKPYQQLAGYAKTDDLAPGAVQTVTIAFNTRDMASYDEATATYVMDRGDYVIRLGDSSRNTRVAAKVRLETTLTTDRVNHELNDQHPDTTLSSDPADFYTYPGQKADIAGAPVRVLNTRGFVAEDHRSALEQRTPVDSSSPYYPMDGNLISATTAYVDDKQTDWQGTGAPYSPKTGETVRPVTTAPTATLYDVKRGRVSLEQFVAGLSPEQLANIVEGTAGGGSTLSASGAAGYTTAAYEKLGIPSMVLADGPAGLRLQQKIPTTPTTYQWATAFPIGTLLAQTWDRDLVRRVGVAVGKEMREYGVSLWLAPGMNIHRDPLGGRNFEYYSEDPLVSGLTAAATTGGVQSIPGAGVTVKHLVANEQETDRGTTNSVIGERALREVYLRPFQIAVQTAQPMAVMDSYNKVNGTYAPGNYDLLSDVVRGEWGFQGLVMSDWTGTTPIGPVPALYAGNDLIMPGLNPTEVRASIEKVPPAIDVNGFPAVNKTVISIYNLTRYNLVGLGGLTLTADGTQVLTTTVDATTDLSVAPLSTTTVYDAAFNPTTTRTPYGTVQNAYNAIASLLTSSALTAQQKAAVTLTPTYTVPGDTTSPVTSYTVTFKGNYASTFTLRLGDLQRSAMRVLHVAMQTAQFQQLAAQQGVSGITVRPYTAQFTNLRRWVDVTKGPIVTA